MKNSIQQIIEYTNTSLIRWYKNAKEDYGVEGYGIAFHNPFEKCITIFYKEDGEEKTYSVHHFEENTIDYVFDVWSEQAY